MRNTSFALAVVAGTLGLWLPTGSSSAQMLLPSKTLLNPSPNDDDFFGYSVAVSGNNLLVGAPLDDNQGSFSSGAAYLFDAATGELLQTLLNPSLADRDDQFGTSVAASGNNLLVGAYFDTNQGAFESGAAYLFDASTGDLLQTLLNPSPDDFDNFGTSVAVSGNRLLVGAPYDDNQGAFESGAAYLFDASTGDLLQTLLNPSPDFINTFGESVALSKNYLLIGDSFGDAAYLFDSATGELLQTLLNPDPDKGDGFGLSIAVLEDYLLIGDPFNDNQGAFGSGAAYLFDAATGDLRQTLLNPSPNNFDLFGRSVAVLGNSLLVGALDDNQGTEFSGAVYLFDAATGDLLKTLLNPSPDDGDGFGLSIAVSANNLLVSAPGDDNQGADRSGAAYLYQLSSPPTTVPEPGSLGLLAIGTLGATALRQRRQS